jgi:hypothetical protein
VDFVARFTCFLFFFSLLSMHSAHTAAIVLHDERCSALPLIRTHLLCFSLFLLRLPF